MSVTLARRFKNVIKRIPVIERRIFQQRSYSQEGEDRVLSRFFGHQPRGFYVDVGAHHPFRFSNTQIFYERGWNGINIDALPGSMAPFRRERSRDINLEIGIGEEASTGRFFVFNEPAVNTFDEELAKRFDVPPWRIERIIDVPIRPLRDVLDEFLPPATTIDFMSIDVEGLDLQVLRSMDWTRHRPRVVLAESLGKALDSLQEEPAAAYLKSVGYRPYAKTVNTFFYIDSER